MTPSPNTILGRVLPLSVLRRFRALARMTRWALRTSYARHRFSKALKVLEVRLWREPLVRWFYSRTDYAPAPCAITLRLTNSCNLRCVQCGQWGERGVFTRPGRAAFPKEMSTEEWKAFIARVAGFCSHIYFFGGEPFLRSDCLELVKCATAKNIIAGVNTNGNFLKNKGGAIVDSGMDYLIVSLDGPKEVNNRIRLGKGDVYQRVVEGVEELVRAKRAHGTAFPLIELNMTLTDLNQAHIAQTGTLARELGCDYFAVTFGIFTTPELAQESSAQFKREFGIDPRFYEGFVRDVSRMDPELIAGQIRDVKKLWGSRYNQYPQLEFDITGYYNSPERPLRRAPCITPWLTMQVMASGEMAFCEDFADLVVGNVRESDPLALWNGRASAAWRRRIRTKGIFHAETRCCGYYLH